MKAKLLKFLNNTYTLMQVVVGSFIAFTIGVLVLSLMAKYGYFIFRLVW